MNEHYIRHLISYHDPDNMKRMISSSPPHTTRARMDALVDGHYRAEEAGDIAAIVEAFTTDAAHDVAGRPGGTLHGAEEIAAFYAGLLADLETEHFEPVRRRYGDSRGIHESVLHAT